MNLLRKKKEEAMANKMLERKEKRKLLAAKNKKLNKSKKVKQDKQDEKALWQKIRGLKSCFAKMKEIKKQNKYKKLVL